MRARLHRAGPLAGARRHPARHWAPAKAAEAPFIEAAGAPSRRRPRMHSRTRSWPAARRCSKSCLRRSWRACPPATAARRSGRAASGTTATGGRAARTVCTAGARAALPLDRQAGSSPHQRARVRALCFRFAAFARRPPVWVPPACTCARPLPPCMCAPACSAPCACMRDVRPCGVNAWVPHSAAATHCDFGVVSRVLLGAI